MELIINLFKPKVYMPIITISLIIISYFFIKRLISRLFIRKNIDFKRQQTIINVFTNAIKYLLVAFVIIIILDAVGIDTKTIIASLGIVGLVIGLALQDVIKDFIAGFFIILENQYKIGDCVTIDGFFGKVVSFSFKTTKLLSFTGELKTIPNRYIEQTINHSVENPTIHVVVPLSAEYDINKTKEIINKVCEKLSLELKNVKSKVVLTGVISVSKIYVKYRISVTIEPLTAVSTTDMILSTIQTEINKHRKKLLIED